MLKFASSTLESSVLDALLSNRAPDAVVAKMSGSFMHQVDLMEDGVRIIFCTLSNLMPYSLQRDMRKPQNDLATAVWRKALPRILEALSIRTDEMELRKHIHDPVRLLLGQLFRR